MVQFIHVGPSRSQMLQEEMGRSLGQGLSDFMGTYVANKSLNSVLSDPTLKNAPMSEKMSRLQLAMQPHGEKGEKILQQRLQIEQQAQQETLIKKAKALSKDPNITPSEIALSLYEIAGPQGAKMVPQLTDMILRQRQNEAILRPPSTGTGQPNQIPQQQNQTPSPAIPGQNIVTQGRPPVATAQPQQQNAIPPQQNIQPQQKNIPTQEQAIFPTAEQGQGIQIAAAPGMYAGITPEENIHAKAAAAQQATGDPEIYNLVYQREQNRNTEKLEQNKQYVESQALETKRQADILQRNQQLETFAKNKLTKGESAPDEEELNDFMRIGQKYSNYSPNEWFEKTRPEFDKFMNIKSQFDKMFVPGALRGIYLGGEERAQELARITPIVQDLKLKYGKGSYARNRLAELGLTQTEIEKVYNPLTKGFTSEVLKLPKGVNPPMKSAKEYLTTDIRDRQKNSPQVDLAYSNQIADFLLKHGGSNSLLAMRDEIMNKRHYSWEQFHEGLRIAEEKGFSLNPEQEAEREELRNPPKDSIANIFRGFGNIIEYLRGSR